MIRKTLLLFIFTAVMLAETNTTKGFMSLFDIELDPYYSNIGYYQAIDDSPIVDVGEMDEISLYRHFIFSPKIPKFFLIEASINPLPILGVYLKNNHEHFYEDAYITDDFNYIKALTAGFEEPYALSFFMGDVATFTAPEEERKSENKGYLGYLLSVGDQHIKDNEVIKENWYELEVKVKGDRNFEKQKLGYSFRFGIKVHEHKYIQDIYYIGLRRNMTDFTDRNDFFRNFGFDLRTDFSQKTNSPIRHLLLFEKNFPVKNKDYAFGLKLGVLWENAQKYTGNLQREERDTGYQLLLQPNIIF